MEERIFKDNYMEAIFAELVTEEIDRRVAETEEDMKNKKIVFSKAHEKRMQKMFRGERRKEALKILTFIGKKVAVIAVVLFAGLSAVLLTFSPDVRAAIKDTFVTWYEKFTKFEPKPAEEEFIPGLNFRPSFVPEGYAKEELSEQYILYQKSDEEFVIFEYAPIDDTMSVDNEGLEYKLIAENSIDYHTFTALQEDKFNCVIWEKGGYRFSLDGYLEVPVLLEIAKSVEKI